METQTQTFRVVYPGKFVREFPTLAEAVRFLAENPGVAHLYGPTGLIVSKGILGADIRARGN